eukprot:scaffold22620_cov131-Cylindrotheca_fusiformis.AAC.11
MEREGKINLKIYRESKMIATFEDLSAGDQKAYYQHWLSGTFPRCDGNAHQLDHSSFPFPRRESCACTNEFIHNNKS